MLRQAYGVDLRDNAAAAAAAAAAGPPPPAARLSRRASFADED
jgi:hypothetical protein